MRIPIGSSRLMLRSSILSLPVLNTINLIEMHGTVKQMRTRDKFEKGIIHAPIFTTIREYKSTY